MTNNSHNSQALISAAMLLLFGCFAARSYGDDLGWTEHLISARLPSGELGHTNMGDSLSPRDQILYAIDRSNDSGFMIRIYTVRIAGVGTVWKLFPISKDSSGAWRHAPGRKHDGRYELNTGSAWTRRDEVGYLYIDGGSRDGAVDKLIRQSGGGWLWERSDGMYKEYVFTSTPPWKR